MTDLTLRELFVLARTNVARIFHEGGEVLPMWHAIPRHGPHMLIATAWNDDDEKDEAIRVLREKFRELEIERYAFMVEAWIVEKMVSPDSPRPSEHPDRREVIRITCEDRNGDVLSGHYYILRPEHSKATLSPFREDPPGMLASGRMSHMLMSVRGH